MIADKVMQLENHYDKEVYNGASVEDARSIPFPPPEVNLANYLILN
jgi:hypothetical protein